MWNTRANGDATKANLFYTLERDVDIRRVEWISANRIALGLRIGLIEIWEIDEEGETTNSRVIKQFKQGNVSLRISTILHEMLPIFAFHLVKGAITDLKWNEMTEYLASCSFDGLIKVIISFIRCQLVDEWEDDGQEKTSLISYFPPFVSDLVDRQRRC